MAQVQPVVVGYASAPGQVGMGMAPPRHMPGDETVLQQYVPLQEIRYDVTNLIESFMTCCCRGWHRETLILTDVEAIYRRKDLCGTDRTRLPYAQLGYLERVDSLLCDCAKLASDLTGENPMAKKPSEIPGISPGVGCGNGQLVGEMLAELQNRKNLRGGIAQMRKLDRMVEKLDKMTIQLYQYMNKAKVPFDKTAMPRVDREVFPTETINVTNCCDALCCGEMSLRLGQEEATLHIEKPMACMSRDTQREYQNMDVVQKIKSCFCCFGVKSALAGGMVLAPGVPCANRGKVQAIAAKMRERLRTRGQTGQMIRQERMLRRIAQIETLLTDTMEKTSGADKLYPPAPEHMLKLIGGDVKGDIDKMKQLVHQTLPNLKPIDVGALTKTFPEETFDVTDNCESCMACFCTCGIAGWGVSKLLLKRDDYWIETKDNMGTSDAKIPYGELDSVEIQRDCCCCHSVNEFSPGWCGCMAAERVATLAKELELRKTYRGQLAQWEHLRAAQVSTLALDLKFEALCKALGVSLPPSPDVVNQVYTNQGVPIPRVLTPGKPLSDLEVVFNPKPFPDRSHEATNKAEAIFHCVCCCRGWLNEELILEEREMLQTYTDLCSSHRIRTPYSSLAGVDISQDCVCCHEISDVVSPGCGCCNAAETQTILDDLMPRIVKRGQIAQLNVQEQIINDILAMEVKIDALAHAKGLAYPPSEEVLREIFEPSK